MDHEHADYSSSIFDTCPLLLSSENLSISKPALKIAGALVDADDDGSETSSFSSALHENCNVMDSIQVCESNPVELNTESCNNVHVDKDTVKSSRKRKGSVDISQNSLRPKYGQKKRNRKCDNKGASIGELQVILSMMGVENS